MVFKLAYFVDLTKGYQPEKFQYCKLSGSSVIEELQEQNVDHHYDITSYFWDLKCLCFVKLL